MAPSAGHGEQRHGDDLPPAALAPADGRRRRNAVGRRLTVAGFRLAFAKRILPHLPALMLGGSCAIAWFERTIDRGDALPMVHHADGRRTPRASTTATVAMFSAMNLMRSFFSMVVSMAQPFSRVLAIGGMNR